MSETASGSPLPVVAARHPSGLFERVRAWLPEGRGLPAAQWHIRHRGILAFVWAHAVGLAVFGLVQGWPPGWALGEGLLIAALGGVAASHRLSRQMRSAVAALACVFASAVLVQFSGGYIEAHFHFFVVVALISLYQDWVPFLTAIAFVAVDHGLLGSIAPTWVYNHPAGIANPWGWAAIHAVLVLAECVALVVVWRANEESRAETERILKSAGEGIVGVDGECRITFANPAARTMLGLESGDAVGVPLYEVVRGADGRQLFSGPEVLRRNPGAFSLEANLARPGQEPLQVELLCNPIVGRAHAEGAVVAIRDMSERARAERERAKAVLQEQELTRLREVNHFKTQFLNMAAHELNTPLTPIKMQLHVLKGADDKAGGFQRSSIEMIDRNFERLAELVQELLDSTQLQSNRLRITRRPTDLAPLVQERIQSYRDAAMGKGLRMEASVPGRLPCDCDPLRFSQVVDNLLSNAIKFTPAGGTVRIEASRRGDRIEVAVQDTGVGLTAEQVERLFQPFSQVHEGQVASHRGSGLGLYIARGIMELHGGTLTVASAGPGKGSRFSVTLPAFARMEAPAAA